MFVSTNYIIVLSAHKRSVFGSNISIFSFQYSNISIFSFQYLNILVFSFQYSNISIFSFHNSNISSFNFHYLNISIFSFQYSHISIFSFQYSNILVSVFNIQTFYFLLFNIQTFQFSVLDFQYLHIQIQTFQIQIFKSQMLHIEISNFNFFYYFVIYPCNLNSIFKLLVILVPGLVGSLLKVFFQSCITWGVFFVYLLFFDLFTFDPTMHTLHTWVEETLLITDPIRKIDEHLYVFFKIWLIFNLNYFKYLIMCQL
jgi:hypothetical protein